MVHHYRVEVFGITHVPIHIGPFLEDRGCWLLDIREDDIVLTILLPERSNALWLTEMADHSRE